MHFLRENVFVDINPYQKIDLFDKLSIQSVHALILFCNLHSFL